MSTTGNVRMLSDSVTISVDAMGGDHAPAVVIEGINLALGSLRNVRFLLFGREAEGYSELRRPVVPLRA